MTGNISKAKLYFHTIRHLKLRQIFGRVVFHLKKVRPEVSAPPSRRVPAKPFIQVARRRPSLVGATQFDLLNQSGDLEEHGWDGSERDKLWRYNQHYFDDLNALNSSERLAWHRSLIARWLQENPPGQSSGWEPYPTSLRIVNWVKWSLLSEPLSDEATHSLAIQARWLMNKIEWHLLGNHLFSNAKALVFAGLAFEGSEADRWLRRGSEILLDQLQEQILADGGHFELSPMYHALALEDALDLINILRWAGHAASQALLGELDRRVESMLAWLDAMSHPDDRIAFFNDAAFEVAPGNAELRAYASRLGYSLPASSTGLKIMEPSGYARLAKGPAVIIADVAEVGPSYLPGHAHADTLSFECSVFDHRLVVNSGTSVYGTSHERLRQRGTMAHSTVCVEKQDSSQVWSGFRVARRAKILGRTGFEAAGAQILEASHDGYHRIAAGLTHKRVLELSNKALIVKDSVIGAKQAEAFFHLHPDVGVDQETSHKGRIRLREGQILQWVSSNKVSIVSGTWHPNFNVVQPNQCIVAALDSGHLTLEFSWS